MHFRIADTFTDSLTKLTNEEQKAVKTTAFDLQMNPASPRMQFHKVSNTKDPNFWSIRVNKDIRLIIHKANNSLLLCYVGHHDDAYKWAERRKMETHPKTGAAQIVELREKIKEITIPQYVETTGHSTDKPPLFSKITEEELLKYGIPPDWIGEVKMANEDTLFDLADHLPQEATEALLDLAVGVKPKVPEEPIRYEDPLDHPDAQRRFRVMKNIEELKNALEYPWEKWCIFLHPEQRQIVEKDYSGPARVSGSAGTGKTIVAIHRAVHLARNNLDARVLLATFSETLANSLKNKLRRLISSEPHIGERLEVYDMNNLGRRLYELNFDRPNIASKDIIREILAESAAKCAENRFSLHFLITEWEEVIDAWQLTTWEEYKNIKRLGRKMRLPEKQRRMLWSIFKRVNENLENRKIITFPKIFKCLTSQILKSDRPPFDFAIVDEAQDVSIPQLRFLSALGGERQNGLFFAGDLGQRIFQQPFSWKSLGVNIRGRSSTLKINYRTTHQIRIQADRLLAPEISDVDGNTEDRRGTISLFNGPKPTIVELNTMAEERQTVSNWLTDRVNEGVSPHAIGVFVRSSNELERARSVVQEPGLNFKILDEKVETTTGHVSICTMHLAKGLEFRGVVVMACDDGIMPMQGRIETVSDETDLEEIFNTERHLLYVACTRARDFLLLTGIKPASEFIDDLKP